MYTLRTLVRGLAALSTVAAMAACEDELAAPPEMGSVSAEIYDDSAAVGAPNGAAALDGAERIPVTGGTSFSGAATGRAQVFLYSDVEGWVELGLPALVTLDLQSRERATVHGSAPVPAGEYTRVRLVLEGFDAELAAGAMVGGIRFNAGVRIAVGGQDGRVEIEKAVTPFTITARTVATIGFDLNSEVWVTQTSAEARSCEDADIQSATTAHVAD